MLLLRKPGAMITPSIWAEDGTIFLQQALSPGQDWLAPYAGQIWVIQRALMALVAQFPMAWIPLLLYVVSCVAAVLFLSPLLQSRAIGLFGSFRWQAAAFFLLLLMPTVTEIQGNVANLHLWMAVGLLVLVALPAPVTVPGRVAEIGYLCGAVLTGFLGVILTPAALWAAHKYRTRFVLLRAGVVVTGAAVNVSVWMLSDRPPGSDVLDRLATVPGALAKRWGGGMTLGNYIMRFVWPEGFLSIFLIPALLILGLLVYLAWRDRAGPSPVWLLTGALWLVLGIVSPAGGIAVDWVQSAIGGWRYVAVAIATGFLVLIRALSVGSTRLAAVGLAACSLAILSGAYLRSPQPPVTASQMRDFERCIESANRPCVLPIAPAGWTVIVE